MVRKDNLRRYGGLPYDGLFGDSNIVSVLEQVIADPYMEYHPIDLVHLTKETPPTVRKSLKVLTSTGLLIKDKTDIRHPIYRVDTKSKKYLVLNLLAYAILDDKLGTDTVDKFIADYCDTVLREKYATVEWDLTYILNLSLMDRPEIKNYTAQNDQIIGNYVAILPQKETYNFSLEDTGKPMLEQKELQAAAA